MPDPIDPDLEDRRPDRDREPEIFDEQEMADPYEDERLEEEVVSTRQLGLFDDEEDMLDYSNDLKEMDGPDA